MNGRPLSMRKKVQFLVIVTILTWATQTLVQQWGYGQDVSAEPAAPAAKAASERFMPGTARFAAGATLELRGEATVFGGEVKLRQVCRWSGADAAVFTPVADLVLARIPTDAPFKAVTLDQIRDTLRDAGVNLAVVKFSGPTSCTISRSDVEFDEQHALLQWASAKEGKEVARLNAEPAPGTETAGEAGAHDGEAAQAALRLSPETPTEARVQPDTETNGLRTLRDALVHDLSVRLRVPIEHLQVSFDPRDEQALRLAEPQFKFNIEPKRVRNLGGVVWDVQVVTEAGQSQKIYVAATARAWQNQAVLAKPVSFKQVIRDSDLAERRVLVDRLDDDPLLSQEQAVGQQAARELKPGTVVSSKMVQPVPLARPGQFITVTLGRGGVKVKTVGRAMEAGSFGQTIKVKNEATKDVYEVVLTGQQEATMGPEAREAPASHAGVASLGTE